MASSNGFKDLISNSVLNKLYSRLTESPFAKPDIGSFSLIFLNLKLFL